MPLNICGIGFDLRPTHALKLLVLLMSPLAVQLAPLPAQAEDARVLPAGRSRLSFVYASSLGVTQTYNSLGQSESLTAAYNMELNSSKLQTFSPDVKSLVQLLNSSGLRYNAGARSTDHGLTLDASQPLVGDALSAGALAVDATITRQQYSLAYQYGLTDRLTLGFMVPIINNRVNVNGTLTGLNTANDIYQGFNSGMGTGFLGADGLNQLRTLSTESFQKILADRGYERFQSTDTSAIGDLIIGGRYNYLNRNVSSGLWSGQWISSFQGGFTIPTGKLKAPSQVTSLDFGNGNWDLGLAHISNYSPWTWVTVSHSLNYTYRFASSRLLRVRSSPTDLIPDASTEEMVGRNLGDKYWTTLGLRFNLTQSLSIEGNYEWYWKNADRFQGSTPGRDYSYLALDTEASSQTLQVGISLDSINAFLNKKFPLPGQLAFNAYSPLKGRNSPVAPYGTLELTLYF